MLKNKIGLRVGVTLGTVVPLRSMKIQKDRPMNPLYPLRFQPVYKDYLWGGSRIPRRFNRNEPEGVYAESWEISTHPEGLTTIANGVFSGKTLDDLLPEYRRELLGSAVQGDDFPLLIKLIDARDTLSVQVHPNDDNATIVHGSPKTEMWYFLEGDGSSQVYCGLKPRVGREEFLQAIENQTFSDTLQSIPARKGEAVFVPGGCVHAIGAGCLILEVQQNSNTTYRLYDWGRVGADGKPRDLHIDQALQVIDWENKNDPRCVMRGTEVQRCDYFKMDRFDLRAETRVPLSGKSFHALFIAEGEGVLRWSGGEEKLTTGQSWLIPASLGEYHIFSMDMTLLRVTIP